MPGGASKAMVADGDGTVFEAVAIDIPKVERLSSLPLHAELLVEVAVIDLAAPADTQRVVAHETRDRRRVEGADEQLHIGLQFPVVPEPGGKTADRHVCNRVKAMEVDVEMLLQFAFVVGFEFRLVRREEGAVWIVDEIKRKVVLAPVTEMIENSGARGCSHRRRHRPAAR